MPRMLVASILSVAACATGVGCKARGDVGEAPAAPAALDVGIAAYTFRQYTLLEAIEKTHECGSDAIELFTWQVLGPDDRDVKVDPRLTDAQVVLIGQRLHAAGVRAVNAYVGNDLFEGGESAVRKVFEFAKRLGLPALTGEVPPETLDIIERMVKEYDVRFCFHNHPRDAARPEYRNWDPAHVLSLLKDRDPRVGASLDVGHIARSGLDPVEAVRILGSRINSVHLKDAKEARPDSPDVPLGEGISNIRGVLVALHRQGFRGQLAVEYENESERLMDDVKRCLSFARQVEKELR